jgi:hypothetical protein
MFCSSTDEFRTEITRHVNYSEFSDTNNVAGRGSNQQAAALVTLLLVIAINLAIGMLPHVDNFAHIGGFLTGFLLGFVLLMRPHYAWSQRYVLPSSVKDAGRKYLPYQWALLALASVLAVIG